MAKSIFHQNNLSSGEASPRFYGRYDLGKYPNAVKLMENFLIYQLGGVMFRPGTIFADETKSSANKANLIPFQYSSDVAYIIEVGNAYMRFFTDGAQVELTGNPVEITTPFLQADLFALQYAQSADTMYITHKNYPPQKLIRTSSTSFSITPVKFIRGPFLDDNIDTSTTLTPSSATGATTLTVTIAAWGTTTQYIVNDWVTESATTYRCVVPHTSGTFATDLAAGYWVAELFFKKAAGATHVGSLWKVKSAVVLILTVADGGLSATAIVQAEPDGTAGAIGGTSAYYQWAEGAFSSYRGYPSCCCFHEQRLFYANTPFQPQTFWGSSVGAYDDFQTGSNDDDAVSFTIANDQINAIRWMKSTYYSLQMGTSGGTASVSGVSGSIITATEINVSFDTDIGAAALLSQRISSFVMYLQANTYQMRELVYNYYVNRNIAGDMNIIADHVIRDGGGAVDFSKQLSPNARIWVVRNDGQIAALTRNPEQEVMGWCRMVAGRTAVGPGVFEAIAIVQKDAQDDEIWVIVKRNVNGNVKRYVEYFSPETFDDPWDAVRLDCSLTYDSPKTISGITKAAQAVVTATSHGFSDGDHVKIDNVVGMTELNGNNYTVSDKTTHTFKLKDDTGAYINSTAFSAYDSGGEARKMVTTLSGLDHLEGEVVTVVVDGGLPATQQTYLVSSGAITLVNRAAVVTCGLPYTGKIQLLKLADKGGSTLNRRIYDATLRVDRSLGIKIGMDEDTLDQVYFATPNAPLGHSPDLFTGDKEISFESWWSKEAEVVIMQDTPLPLFILSIVLRSEIEEKAS